MYTHLLVPTDFSAQARLALDLALELLPDDGARLCLLTAAEREPRGAELRSWNGAPTNGDAGSSMEADARQKLHALAEQIARPGLKIEEIFSWVQPALAIIDVAQQRDVNAIVLGSRGLSDIVGLVLGSISHRVLHTADRRVIIVR